MANIAISRKSNILNLHDTPSDNTNDVQMYSLDTKEKVNKYNKEVLDNLINANNLINNDYVLDRIKYILYFNMNPQYIEQVIKMRNLANIDNEIFENI